ncbi:DUF6907 domain-containing protein [Kitasatospora terrestris]|uniref:Uncharacterized protein n=1 Tax=Kitasatospora terrestris TaxID=258051 RepID=A0ABP9E1Z6_9ACTN
MTHRQGRVDRNHPGSCAELGGRCTGQGPHFDHFGPMFEVAAPHHTDGEPLLDARLAIFDSGPGYEPTPPVISVGWHGAGTELSAAEAIAFAADLEQYALHLCQLARQLQRIHDQA